MPPSPLAGLARLPVWVSRANPRVRAAAGGLATIGLAVVGVLPNTGMFLPVDIALSVVLGGVVLVAGAAGAARERQLREVASDAATEASAILAEGFEPVLAAMEQVAAARRNSPALSHAQGMMLKAVTSALAAVVGPERTRSCFFDFDDAGGVKRLSPRPATWAGRGEPPRTIFRQGDPGGDEAIAMVEAGGEKFVDDVDATPPLGWDPSRRYRTFISVAVALDGRPLGMLSVDALEAGSFSETSDVPTVRALAKMLAIALG